MVIRWQPSLRVRWLLPLVLVGGGTIALIAYLLYRFPYDGLYGQDSYAYYYQARALWHDMSGAPLPPNPLFDSQGFRWPVGYYLHLIAGFVIGGLSSAGGRALTLLLMALAPALVYA